MLVPVSFELWALKVRQGLTRPGFVRWLWDCGFGVSLPWCRPGPKVKMRCHSFPQKVPTLSSVLNAASICLKGKGNHTIVAMSGTKTIQEKWYCFRILETSEAYQNQAQRTRIDLAWNGVESRQQLCCCSFCPPG